MCGIYGYIGKENAYEKVIKGLSLLQYRGYDSCGIAYFNNGFKINKAVGTLDNLNKCNENNTIAFGHTRWATNGVVNEINAHPHVSFDGKYTIVHNGIIKNSDELKDNLLKQSIKFRSETDTEVIANILTTFKQENELYNLFDILNGTFSLIIGKGDGTIYLVKKFSPLHVLKTEDGIYVSSDISSMPSGELYSLQDNDILKIENNQITMLNKKEIQYKPHNNSMEKMQLGNFKHYMLKEIFETPMAIANTYHNIKNNDFINIFNLYSKFTFVGCGTAYNSCLIGEYFFKNELDKEVETILASNYSINKEIQPNHLHIIVSQSGETADCIKVAEQIKKNNGKFLIITNEPNSTIASMANYHIFTKANKELAVASTKTYCCQVFVFAYICQKLKDNDYELNIDEFSEHLKQYIANLNINKIAEHLKEHDKMILIGKDIDYYTLLEASLKIREIDYVYTLPMYSGELKHGTLSLIDKDSCVITLNSSNNKNKLNTTINEINSREGKVIEFDSLMQE